MRYIIAELGPYILCDRDVNPIEILETLNCMGVFQCTPLLVLVLVLVLVRCISSLILTALLPAHALCW